MRQFILIITIIASLAATQQAAAVNDKEMDQARAIATQCYLRYANDGSGYLDEYNPKSMSELEKILKAKEKENIKAFKAIALPKDYSSWDKAKLVEYWTETAFSTKGLIEKGRAGKSRARKKLNAMAVAVQAQPAAASAENSVLPSPAADVADAATPATSGDKAATPAAADSSANAMQPQADPLADDTLFVDEDVEIKKASNNTWLYIVILCILVGVVVALVVFASNVMKKSQGRGLRGGAGYGAAIEEEIRKKYDKQLKSKDDELKALSQKVADLSGKNDSLAKEVERLKAELSQSGRRATQAAAVQPASQPAPRPSSQPAADASVTSKPESVRKEAGTSRTIYLGRANAKGIFVRADRMLNPGHSVFRLDTTDGYAGTFRVAADRSVWDLGLDNPREVLAGACICADIDDTAGMECIVNDSAGTAIFEGGCWKVIRKAKIHYE